MVADARGGPALPTSAVRKIGFAGMYASWYLDVPSGAAITLAGASAFCVAYAGAGQRRRALSRIEAHDVDIA